MVQELVKEWEIRLTKAQVGHYLAAELFQKVHLIVGSALIILSSLVTAFLFINTENDVVLNLIITASIISTILAGIQTLIRPSEQSEIHRSKATSYGSLRRKIELHIALASTDVDYQLLLNDIRSEWDGISGNSPVTPNKLRVKVKDILKEDNIDESDLVSLKNKQSLS